MIKITNSHSRARRFKQMNRERKEILLNKIRLSSFIADLPCYFCFLEDLTGEHDKMDWEGRRWIQKYRAIDVFAGGVVWIWAWNLAYLDPVCRPGFTRQWGGPIGGTLPNLGLHIYISFANVNSAFTIFRTAIPFIFHQFIILLFIEISLQIQKLIFYNFWIFFFQTTWI